MHDATRPAFGRVRAPKSRSVTRLLRTKLGRLGHHRPDNRVREEAGLSRDDLAPLRLATSATDGLERGELAVTLARRANGGGGHSDSEMHVGKRRQGRVDGVPVLEMPGPAASPGASIVPAFRLEDCAARRGAEVTPRAVP
jgi:hypothetical protein